MLTLLLVDDHLLFRQGLTSLFAYYDNFRVIGEAGNQDDALAQARLLRPDIVLMDIDLGGTDGIELTRQIKAELPNVAIVMLTIHEDSDKILRAVKAGASGYLGKNIAATDLVAQLRNVARGEAALTAALAARLLEEVRSQDQGPASEVALTFREQQVLELIAQRMSNHDIAEHLVISEHTVKNHVKSILAKLETPNRRAAAAAALARGWLRHHDPAR